MTPAYQDIRSRVEWGRRDRFGYACAYVHPLRVLRAAGAPASVLDAVALAIRSNCSVVYESHSCHIGGSESIVVFGPVPDDVRAELDAIDASGVRDAAEMTGSYRGGEYLPNVRCRWSDGRHRVCGREHWSWTLDEG